MIKLTRTDALYQQITTYYEGEIRRGRLKPGDRIPSTQELAALFSVNPDTVQQSLRILSRRGLISRVRGRGTFVRDTVECRTFGIVFDKALFTDADKASAAAFFNELTRLLRDHRWNFRLFMPGCDSDAPVVIAEIEKAIAAGELRGMIEFCSTPQLSTYVHNTCPLPFGTVDFAVDYGTLTRMGLNYLEERGFRSIDIFAQCSAEPEHREISAYTAEIASFRARTGWTREQIRMHETGCYYIDGYELTKKLWSPGRTPPEALLIANDRVFHGAWYALLELGVRVPGDVAIITHSNRGLEPRVHVPLTRLEVDPVRFAEETLADLEAKLAGETYAMNRIQPVLIPGKSCGEE